MSRAISVRAWDRAAGEWFYFNFVPFFFGADSDLLGDRFRNIFKGKDIDPNRIDLEIGLRDHKGTHIYENDVVEHGNGDRFAVEPLAPPRKEMYYEYDHYDDFLSMSDVDYEVIGNIYENPELLKGA